MAVVLTRPYLHYHLYFACYVSFYLHLFLFSIGGGHSPREKFLSKGGKVFDITAQGWTAF